MYYNLTNNKSFILNTSKLNINGDCSLMVEYGSVAPEKRVRFPPFACKLKIEIKEMEIKNKTDEILIPKNSRLEVKWNQ